MIFVKEEQPLKNPEGIVVAVTALISRVVRLVQFVISTVVKSDTTGRTKEEIPVDLSSE